MSEQVTWDGTTYVEVRRGAGGAGPGGGGVGVVVGRLELVVAPAVRLHVEAGGWVLRGGVVGREVLWRRGSEEHQAVADGFTGAGPAYALALRPLLADGPRRLRLVEVTGPVLATRLVDQEWAATPGGVVVRDLATGERRTLTLP